MSIALAACGGEGGRGPAAEGLTAARTPATPILAQLPHLGVHLGVSCPGESNVITCDRVGLAVGLSAPATALEAWIGGQPVAMAIRPNTAERDGQGMYFEGHLHPAGLSSPGPLHVIPDGPNDSWAGGNPVSVPVRLIAHYPDGSSAETTVQRPLAKYAGEQRHALDCPLAAAPSATLRSSSSARATEQRRRGGAPGTTRLRPWRAGR